MKLLFIYLTDIAWRCLPKDRHNVTSRITTIFENHCDLMWCDFWTFRNQEIFWQKVHKLLENEAYINSSLSVLCSLVYRIYHLIKYCSMKWNSHKTGLWLWSLLGTWSFSLGREKVSDKERL